MKIETKYNIGDRVWIVYELYGEVSVYDDTISTITIEKDGIFCWLDTTGAEREEKYIVLYDDKEGLVNKIIETMNEIHKKEEGENVK